MFKQKMNTIESIKGFIARHNYGLSIISCVGMFLFFLSLATVLFPVPSIDIQVYLEEDYYFYMFLSLCSLGWLFATFWLGGMWWYKRRLNKYG